MYKPSAALALLAACASTRTAQGPSDTHATAHRTASDDRAASEVAPGTAAYTKLPPYPTAPADPWRGVVGDKPRLWSEDRAHHWVIRGDETECSAAHDHCIDPDAWFVVKNADVESHLPAVVGWEVFGADGKPATATNAKHYDVGADTEWRAFRTVPATKANLVRGAGIVTLDHGAAKPTSGVASHDAAWVYGLLEEVDAGSGTLTIANQEGSYPLWAARVVVLTWEPIGKVQIVGGKQRGELGVKASETFVLP